MRIAIIESQNPVDAFSGVNEAHALEFACRLIGHAPASFTARSHAEFQAICKYLSAADGTHSHDSEPLFVHISCHGNDGGLAFSADFVKLAELALDFLPILRNSRYDGKIVLCLSVCGSGEQKIHRILKERLENNLNKIPLYIISIRGESVLWSDALVAWTLFYHKLSEIKLADVKSLIKIFDQIWQCVGVKLSYHRYDKEQNSFVYYPSRRSLPEDTVALNL